jgi:hypothetical protein
VKLINNCDIEEQLKLQLLKQQLQQQQMNAYFPMNDKSDHGEFCNSSSSAPHNNKNNNNTMV